MKLRTAHYRPAGLGGAAGGFGLNDDCSFVSFKVVAPSSAQRVPPQTRSAAPP